MEWNYLSIPKLQRCSRCSLGIDNWLYPTLYWARGYLIMLGFKLNHVSKRGTWCCKVWFSIPNKNILSMEPRCSNELPKKVRGYWGNFSNFQQEAQDHAFDKRNPLDPQKDHLRKATLLSLQLRDFVICGIDRLFTLHTFSVSRIVIYPWSPIHQANPGH